MESSIKRLTRLGLLLSIALVLGYVEHILPLQALVPIPGIKLGLPNLVILFVWFYMGTKDAILIAILRVGLQSLLFGSTTSFFFSLGGMMLSLLILFLFGRNYRPFSLVGISVFCAAAHQCGQILIATILFRTTVLLFTYLPWLLICGMITGTLIGFLTKRIFLFLRTANLIYYGKDSL